MLSFDQLPLLLQPLLLLGAAGLIFTTGWFIVQLIHLVHGMWKATYGVRIVIDTDDSRQRMPIPAANTDTARQLYELGFVPFGALRRTHPRLKKDTIFHILTTENDTTTARFAEAPQSAVRVSFVTWFTDDSVIVTEQPTGFHVETEKVVMRFLRGSIAAAHAYHRGRVAEWVAQGRTLQPLPDMAAYIVRQSYYLKHYNRVVSQRHLHLIMVANIIAVLVGIAATIGAIVSLFTQQPVLLLLTLGLALVSGNRYAYLVRRFNAILLHPPGAADDTANS